MERLKENGPRATAIARKAKNVASGKPTPPITRKAPVGAMQQDWQEGGWRGQYVLRSKVTLAGASRPERRAS